LISKENFKDIKIPIPSNSFQTQIANLVQESYKQKELSKKLYLEAEKLLLSEL
jgi:DNA-binding cell septation regulator SpoVG